MLPSLILLICLLTGTQQSHVDLICPAAPAPFDPVMCSKITIVSNCLTDADCTGEHQKCCLRECNVLQCITFSFEPGVGEPGPGDPAPAPVPPPPRDGSQTTPACPLLDCRNSGCQFGFETDRNGCDTCICKNSPCPQYGPPPPGYCSRPGEIFIKDGVKCNRPPILFPCNGGNPHKPGKCPPVNLAALTCLAGELPRKCNTDLSCPGIQKCCRRLCEFVCLNPTPVSKPGKCPFVNLALVDCFAGPLHRECNDDGSCPGTQKCCRRGCAFVCRDPGNPCPPEPVCPTSPISRGQCEPSCKFDYETLDGVRCKIRCTRGPRGPPLVPGQPCPPTGCPLIGPPTGPISRPPAPAPAPVPPSTECPPVCAIFCPYGNVLDKNNCPICECKTGNPHKPGKCPAVDLASITCPVGEIPRKCKNDLSCPGLQKCCRQICEFVCVDPNLVTKPGECPLVNLTAITCPDGPLPRHCIDDGSCPMDQKCCRRRCATVCTYPVTRDKPGECPYVNLAAISCPANSFPTKCLNDGSCPGNQKCCNQGCSIDCTDPGNPCPPEPVCPSSSVGPRDCEPRCIFEYVTSTNGVRCKVGCTRGPLGPRPGPDHPCPPTECPLNGPSTDPGEPGPPSPAPGPQTKPCAKCCGPPPCCSFCIDCEIGNPLPNHYCGSTDKVCPKSYYCKTNPEIGRLGVCCKGTRPNKCPADKFKNTKCNEKSKIRLCKTDDNCSPNKKCCKQGCFYYCIDPEWYEWYKW
ncbi:kielin/chordin-like protein isoform X2 [Mytilus californianus]|uniref:kielin/chordin-like protein isoform X2 n=1 Tax=Mytilus californianus TaxID=6549 RepID=UPI00224621D6|nr:kielin/chordin-like protein isoform X2 [Mytilus californianus]